MPQVKVSQRQVHAVDIMEYERGWGSKVEDTLYFNTRPEADQYCKEFNSQNTEKTVPDWYMVAEYRGPVAVVETK